MGFGEFIQAVFTIGAADTRLATTSVKALHRFKILTVDVDFAKFQFAAGPHRGIEV